MVKNRVATRFFNENNDFTVKKRQKGTFLVIWALGRQTDEEENEARVTKWGGEGSALCFVQSQ